MTETISLDDLARMVKEGFDDVNERLKDLTIDSHMLRDDMKDVKDQLRDVDIGQEQMKSILYREVERIDHHEKRIKDHEKRVQKLELTKTE